MFQPDSGLTVTRAAFKQAHIHHKQVSGIQWLTTLAYMVLTVVAWRQADRCGLQ